MIRIVIPLADLESTSKEKLIDAKALYRAGRYDSALYLCGYAVEIALKAAVCKHKGWVEFPDTIAEFDANPQCKPYKKHNFNILLGGTGITIPPTLGVQWTLVSTWKPDSRYTPKIIGGRNTTAVQRQNLKVPTQEMIAAVEAILGILL